jgi:hypothetical protein
MPAGGFEIRRAARAFLRALEVGIREGAHVTAGLGVKVS